MASEMIIPWKRNIVGNRYVVGFWFLILLLILVVPVSATTYIYDKNNATGSIQDLINTSTSGDSIFLDGGAYSENIIIDRPIVFGALDPNNPPEIISLDGVAGITLIADGVLLNDINISGAARNGLLVQSKNNKIYNISIKGLTQGIVLRSAANNEIVRNILINNTVGIEEDHNSYFNTFFLNYFDNTVNIISQSEDDTWYSRPWNYQYSGKPFSGPLGNFWAGYRGSDPNGDGTGEFPQVIQNNDPGGSKGGSIIMDKAPLLQPPEFYTIESPGNQTVHLQGNGDIPTKDTNVLQSQSDNPLAQQGPPSRFPGILIQFWWIIAIVIVVSVVAGIWFERTRRRGRSNDSSGSLATITPTPNTTIVIKPHGGAEGDAQEHPHYGASLPPALDRKYPGAEYIAEGGVSRVFRARDEKENRDVAVKVPIRFDEVTGSQFTKELNLWQGLHHPNIVEIYSSNIFPMPYIEMEYVKSPLATMQFPTDIKTAVSIITGVAEGLRYAHEQGIVHRDIKPENILISPDGTPKITDWGLSKAEGTKQSGIIGFSLEYAAPEQLAPNMYGEPGPWTDIYQLGVLFYEMLTGQVPFCGGGMGEVTHAILHNDPQPLSLSGPNAAIIQDIIGKCMQKRPSDRYKSVADILEDLKKIRT